MNRELRAIKRGGMAGLDPRRKPRDATESFSLYTTSLYILLSWSSSAIQGSGLGQYEPQGFRTVLLSHFLCSHPTVEPQLPHVSPLCCSTLGLASPLVIFPFGQSTTSIFPCITLSPAFLHASQAFLLFIRAWAQALQVSSRASQSFKHRH